MSHNDPSPLENPSLHGDQTQAEILRLIRHVAQGTDAMRGDIGVIQQALAGGAPVIDAARNLPRDVAVLDEKVATLRLIVYGAVGASGLGLLGTAGMALLYVVRLGGGH